MIVAKTVPQGPKREPPMVRWKDIERSVIVLVAWCAVADTRADPPRLWLDADTANEIDDLFAIARMVRQDRFELVGLSSSQWIHYLAAERLPAGQSTVEASQLLNEQLLRALDRNDLPHPRGSVEPIGKPWGGDEPKDSEAARAIIAAAREATSEAKLTVVCLGASTNVASALQLAPEIASRIRVCLLGFHFDAERAVWNKSSFNVRRDLNAADLLLNREGLELRIMPANVANPLLFQRDATLRRCESMGELGSLLAGRWREHCPEHGERIMWDLALVEALINPELAETRSFLTPLENRSRTVRVDTRIDAAGMASSFWRAMGVPNEADPTPEP